ncbi:MAG: hypothetical protein EOO88_15405 [Pedobacter sp.]|nr:MAG: hypothetical protein EOO88_15405 [Pedobacter sp.]
MKRKLLLLLFLLIGSLATSAQMEYRLARSNGQLKLNINGAVVEGYEGKEIIFSNRNATNEQVDDRAKGLVAVSTSGYLDNTGLGFNIVANGQDISVNHVLSNSSDILKIKVPNGMKLSISCNSNQFYQDFVIRNFKGEIEVAANYNKIISENNTGPMNVSTINGAVEATFDREIKGPISLVSIYNYVDVALPPATKANIEMITFYGKLYAARELQIVPDQVAVNKISDPAEGDRDGSTKQKGNAKSLTRSLSIGGAVGFGDQAIRAEKIKGKLNGGGIDLIIRSNNRNVYLRNK